MEFMQFDEKNFTDCYFYIEKECTKNNCIFRHADNAKKNGLVCPSWLQNQCFNKFCHLLHPSKSPAVFKTMAAKIPCFYKMQGACAKAELCPFFHGEIPNPLEEINKQLLEAETSTLTEKPAVSSHNKQINKNNQNNQVQKINSGNKVITVKKNSNKAKETTAVPSNNGDALKRKQVPLNLDIYLQQEKEKAITAKKQNQKQQQNQKGQKNNGKNNNNNKNGKQASPVENNNKNSPPSSPNSNNKGGSMFGVKSLKELQVNKNQSQQETQQQKPPQRSVVSEPNNKKRTNEGIIPSSESSKKLKLSPDSSVVVKTATLTSTISKPLPSSIHQPLSSSLRNSVGNSLNEDEKFLQELEKEIGINFENKDLKGLENVEFDEKEIDALLNQDF